MPCREQAELNLTALLFLGHSDNYQISGVLRLPCSKHCLHRDLYPQATSSHVSATAEGCGVLLDGLAIRPVSIPRSPNYSQVSTRIQPGLKVFLRKPVL